MNNPAAVCRKLALPEYQPLGLRWFQHDPAWRVAVARPSHCFETGSASPSSWSLWDSNGGKEDCDTSTRRPRRNSQIRKCCMRASWHLPYLHLFGVFGVLSVMSCCHWSEGSDDSAELRTMTSSFQLVPWHSKESANLARQLLWANIPLLCICPGLRAPTVSAVLTQH